MAELRLKTAEQLDITAKQRRNWLRMSLLSGPSKLVYDPNTYGRVTPAGPVSRTPQEFLDGKPRRQISRGCLLAFAAVEEIGAYDFHLPWAQYGLQQFGLSPLYGKFTTCYESREVSERKLRAYQWLFSPRAGDDRQQLSRRILYWLEHGDDGLLRAEGKLPKGYRASWRAAQTILQAIDGRRDTTH